MDNESETHHDEFEHETHSEEHRYRSQRDHCAVDVGLEGKIKELSCVFIRQHFVSRYLKIARSRNRNGCTTYNSTARCLDSSFLVNG